MKKSAHKRAASKKRNAKKPTPPAKLKSKAKKLAIKTVKDKLAGKESYKNLSFAARSVIDKRAEKKQGKIEKLARKLLKVVKKKDKERLSKLRSESENYYADF